MSSWVKTVGDYVDIIAKIGAGLGIGLAGITFYLNWDKQKFEEDAKCAETKKSIFEFAYGKGFTGDRVLELVTLLPSRCTSETDREKFVAGVTFVSNWGTARQIETAQAAPPATQPQATPPVIHPQATPPITPSAPPESTEASKIGWVAVGFANSSDFNFVDKNGKNLAGAPAKEATIQAKWSVNIRKAAADWKTSVGVLNQGECFVIEDTKSLPAAGQIQIWASGHAAPCDKAS